MIAAPRPATARPATARRGPQTARAGTVTRLAPPPPALDPASLPEVDDPARRNRRLLRWFGGAAVAVIAIGLVAVLAMVMTGGNPIRRAQGPPDTRPELAKVCPPPSGEPPGGGAAAPAPPARARSTTSSGISYQAYGAPWEPWNDLWTGGTLRVAYGIGQHFVTERYVNPAGPQQVSRVDPVRRGAGRQQRRARVRPGVHRPAGRRRRARPTTTRSPTGWS